MHTILFSGHMIDAKDRPSPRFPAYKEDAAKEQIRKCVAMEKEKKQSDLKGIAGGASGGDILFHEVCLEMEIPTEMYLALPVEEYRKASVSFAGEDWSNRFDKLRESMQVFILPQDSGESNVWERVNIWMLDTALANGGVNMSLIALWNGKGGDGPGGTEHMVKVVNDQKGETMIIDINKI